MNNFYIYLHIKATNGEPFYVGKGKRNRLVSNNNRNNYWHNIVKKYNYDIIILEDNLLEQEALDKEIYWINRIGRKDLKLGPLVNMTNGGDGQLGNKFTLEHRQKLSISHTGKKASDETKLKLSILKKGKKINISIEGRINIGISASKRFTGRKLTEDHKAKISKKRKGSTLTKEHKDKLTGRTKLIYKVMQFTKDGNYIKTFDNHHDAAFEINGNAKDLLYVCKGIVKSHKNYCWKFV